MCQIREERPNTSLKSETKPLTMTLKTQYVHGILDRSGSMSGKTQDVISGFKTNIEELKKNQEDNFDIFVSAKMFDHEEESLFEPLNLKILSEESLDAFMKKYVPKGQTAIRDSLGKSLTYFIDKYNSEKFESCVVYVFTDGLENASKMYSVDKIKKLVKYAESCNINVIYVGSNQNAILSAQTFGINPDLALNYVERPENVISVYRALSGVAQRVRSGGRAEFTVPERSASCPTEETTGIIDFDLYVQPNTPCPPSLKRC